MGLGLYLQLKGLFFQNNVVKIEKFQSFQSLTDLCNFNPSAIKPDCKTGP